MTGEQKSKVAELKAEIAATAGAGTPLKVRTAAVALKQELRRDGITARALARAVGVHESTLCGWERQRCSFVFVFRFALLRMRCLVGIAPTLAIGRIAPQPMANKIPLDFRRSLTTSTNQSLSLPTEAANAA